MAIKEGQTVRVKAPVIEGVVEDVQYSKATGELEYLLPFVDANGDEQKRWFTESDLEVVE